jgi:hypothetical protein
MNTIRLLKVLVLTTTLFMLLQRDAFSQIDKLPTRTPDSVVKELRNFGFLCGTVTIAGTQSPLQGVLLHLDGTSYTCMSRSSGDFSFEPVRPGSYVVNISLPGYESVEWYVGVRAEQQTNIYVPMVPDYSKPSFHQSGGLQVVVSDRSSGYPEFASIEIVELHRTGRTDLEGEYRTYNLASGKYHIRATSELHGATTLDSVDIEVARLSTVFLGLTDTARMSKDTCSLPHRKLLPKAGLLSSRGGNILGIARDKKSHKLLREVSIFLAPFGQRTHSDSMGRFRIMNLQPGFYCLTLGDIGYPRNTIHKVLVKAGEAVFLRLEISAWEFYLDYLIP